jgi:hypothetical protein
MKRIVSVFVAMLILFSCSKNNDPTFSKNRLGKLSGKMKVDEVKSVLQNDSISELKEVSGVVKQSQMEVFDKESGEKTMVLIFQPENDTLKLYAVEILSPEIKSEKGVGLASPYGEWQKKHKIADAERTLRHLVVFVNDLNATLEFDNEDLVSEAQNRSLSEPDPDWIKKEAPPRRLILFMN